jgi:hypothetical protein
VSSHLVLIKRRLRSVLVVGQRGCRCCPTRAVLENSHPHLEIFSQSPGSKAAHGAGRISADHRSARQDPATGAEEISGVAKDPTPRVCVTSDAIGREPRGGDQCVAGGVAQQQRQMIWRPFVVGIQEGNPFTGCSSKTGITGPPGAGVLRQHDHVCSSSGCSSRGVIGGGIIDDNDFEWSSRLTDRAGDCSTDQFGPVMRWNHHAHTVDHEYPLTFGMDGPGQPTGLRYDGHMELEGATFSIVIAAHNEQAVIGRNLLAFTPSLTPGEARVVVVANGCSDSTAAVARSIEGVEVVEIAVASKPAALNAGDTAAGKAFPRIYLDADINVSPETLRALAAALGEPGCLAGSPRVNFITAGRSWPVRAFYAVYNELPYVRDSMIGLGLYGLSRAGRDRFTDFPSITADDLFVQRLFSADERRISTGSFDVETPHNLKSLISVRTRVAYGNQELTESNPGSDQFAGTTASTRSALISIVRQDPWKLPAVIVYVCVTIAARVLARRRGASGWQRDSSTRTA